MADLGLLVAHLREPQRLAGADAAAWNALIRMARKESLLGQLGAVVRTTGVAAPARVHAILDDHAVGVDASQRSARWEARDAGRLLGGRGYPVVLLKGAAYVVAGLPAAEGRTVGDLDILVPRESLDDAEAQLRANGWEALKTDAYDDAYYRQWMHELPPLAHAERGSIIDVHHSILPLTARLRPDAAALIAEAVPVGDGLSVLSPPDMVLHSAAHLFYDGDFEGGLRNLWDIHRLLTHFDAPDFWSRLGERAKRHQLAVPLARALRFARAFFGTKVDATLAGRPEPLDRLVRSRLLARDEWGMPTRPLTRQALYVRSHWLRMPPAMLARHLFTKWRMRRAGAA
jgi:hypothetical protein